MDKLESQKYILKRLQNAKVFKTNIVLGEAVNVFKQIYKGDIITVTSAQEVKDLIDKYNSFPMEKPLIFEDLSKMNTFTQSYLLKFIEEPLFPIILLSSVDNINPVILSRFVNKVKIESSHIVNKSTSVQDFSNTRKDNTDLEEYLDFNNIEIEILTQCPEYLYLKQKYNPGVSLNARSFDKYLSLLEEF